MQNQLSFIWERCFCEHLICLNQMRPLCSTALTIAFSFKKLEPSSSPRFDGFETDRRTRENHFRDLPGFENQNFGSESEAGRPERRHPDLRRPGRHQSGSIFDAENSKRKSMTASKVSRFLCI